MPWNHMQISIKADDLLILPQIGPGEMTREQAHTEVQNLLDRIPQLATTAATWRRGAKDDTVFSGPLVWCIYEHPAGEDPRLAAQVWLDDYAATMRTAGLDVQIAKLPPPTDL